MYQMHSTKLMFTAVPVLSLFSVCLKYAVFDPKVWKLLSFCPPDSPVGTWGVLHGPGSKLLLS